MLKLLQSIFGHAPDSSKGLDDELIERATERVIDGTDPRLRLISGYRKALRDAVVCAIEHTMQLVDGLPEPIELSRQQFGRNESIRTLFVSPDHLDDVLLRSHRLQDYLDRRSGPEPEFIHALLALVHSEKNILGMALEGEMIRRDVAQVSINFGNHQIFSPMDNESDSRMRKMRRVFDYFIEQALKAIVETRSGQSEHRSQQELLASKLRALGKANWSIDSALTREQDTSVEVDEMEKQIVELENRLEETDNKPVTLDRYLEIVADSLKTAPQQLTREVISLKMDRMRIKVDTDDKADVILQLPELSSSNGRKLIVLPVYIPFASLPSRPDFLTEASRYL